MRKSLPARLTSLAILSIAALPWVAAAGPTTQPAFDKGDWTLQLYGGFTKNYGGQTAEIGSATAGVGYFIVDNISLNLELSGYAVDQSEQDAKAVRLALGGRWAFYTIGRLSLLADVNGGISEGDHRIPAGGSHFNFTFTAGPAAAYRLSDTCYLLGGFRYFHLSNGNLYGDDQNPSINAFQGWLGVMIPL
jgi:hypothetical protein